MRAAVLLIAALLDDDLSAAELQELRALHTILRRASRAQEGKFLEILEAEASGSPMPVEP